MTISSNTQGLLRDLVARHERLEMEKRDQWMDQTRKSLA